MLSDRLDAVTQPAIPAEMLSERLAVAVSVTGLSSVDQTLTDT